MSGTPHEEVQQYISTVEDKIQRTVSEFADGEINRETFHRLYDRYHNQIETATEALEKERWSLFYSMRNDMTSAVLRDFYKGRAIGIVVYHHQSNSFLETLGDFVFPGEVIRQIEQRLESYTERILSGGFIDWQTEHLGERDWLLFEPARMTTVIARFENEPSDKQCEQIDRLHRDFEQANARLLAKSRVNAYQLAYPFISFIKYRTSDLD